MSRSLSWFDDETLRKLLSGSGAAVRSRHGLRGRTLITVSSSMTPSTLVGQFGHADRFAAVAHVSLGRFTPAAVTRPGPPEDSAPAIVDGFEPKATRLAAGTAPPDEEPGGAPPPSQASTDEVPAWIAAHEPSISVPPYGASIEQKAESYLEWAMRVCGARAAMIADAAGLPLALSVSESDDRALLSEIGAVTAAFEQGWAGLSSEGLGAPDGHVVLERRRSVVLVVWAAGRNGRLYAVLCADGMPAQAAMALAGGTFRALFGGESDGEG